MNTSRYVIRSGQDLGQTLADVRRTSGLTQAELIEQMAATYDRTYLSRMENGDFSQQIDRALLVLRSLGMTVYAEPTNRAPMTPHSGETQSSPPDAH
jgi:transcriptional regulator with XRE-family HTH domain